VVELLVDGELARALGYGVGSVGAGLLACAAGIALATQRHDLRGRGAGAPS
jgi:fluoride ion exporter CrcB/FEX